MPKGKQPKNCFAKTNSPFWQYEFAINGERERGSTGFEDASDAHSFVEARKTAMRLRQDATAPSAVVTALFGGAKGQIETRWGEALQRYHDDVAAGTDNERNCLRNAAKLLAGIGDKWLHELAHSDFLEFRLKRLKEKNRQGNDISPLTANREIAHARQVFNHVNDLGFRMPPNRPNFGKLIDHSAETAAARTRELTPDEEGRLMKALDEQNQGFADFVEFMLLCGQRKAAAVGLCWADIDWQNLHFTIKLKGKGKTKRSHNVPLTPRMIELIEAQPKAEGTDNVFTYVCRRSAFNEDGTYLRKTGRRYPYTIAGWKKDWKRALAAAGIADFRVHDLRHTNATRLVRATGNIRLAQRLLGHAQITTTGRYAHANIEDVREALALTERRGAEQKDDAAAARRRAILKVVSG